MNSRIGNRWRSLSLALANYLPLEIPAQNEVEATVSLGVVTTPLRLSRLPPQTDTEQAANSIATPDPTQGNKIPKSSARQGDSAAPSAKPSSSDPADAKSNLTSTQHKEVEKVVADILKKKDEEKKKDDEK